VLIGSAAHFQRCTNFFHFVDGRWDWLCGPSSNGHPLQFDVAFGPGPLGLELENDKSRKILLVRNVLSGEQAVMLSGSNPTYEATHIGNRPVEYFVEPGSIILKAQGRPVSTIQEFGALAKQRTDDGTPFVVTFMGPRMAHFELRAQSEQAPGSAKIQNKNLSLHIEGIEEVHRLAAELNATPREVAARRAAEHAKYHDGHERRETDHSILTDSEPASTPGSRRNSLVNGEVAQDARGVSERRSRRASPLENARSPATESKSPMSGANSLSPSRGHSPTSPSRKSSSSPSPKPSVAALMKMFTDLAGPTAVDPTPLSLSPTRSHGSLSLEERMDVPGDLKKSESKQGWQFATGGGFREDQENELIADRTTANLFAANPDPRAFLPAGLDRSTADTVPVRMQFTNSSAGYVMRIFWVSYVGQLVSRKMLWPGETYMEKTFASHVWIISAEKDESRDTSLDLTAAALKKVAMEGSHFLRMPPSSAQDGHLLTVRVGEEVRSQAGGTGHALLWDPGRACLSLSSQSKARIDGGKDEDTDAVKELRGQDVNTKAPVDYKHGTASFLKERGGTAKKQMQRVRGFQGGVVRDLQRTRLDPTADAKIGIGSGTPDLSLYLIGGETRPVLLETLRDLGVASASSGRKRRPPPRR